MCRTVLRHKVTHCTVSCRSKHQFGKPPLDSLNSRLEGFWVTSPCWPSTSATRKEVRFSFYSRAYAGPDYFPPNQKWGQEPCKALMISSPLNTLGHKAISVLLNTSHVGISYRKVISAPSWHSAQSYDQSCFYKLHSRSQQDTDHGKTLCVCWGVGWGGGGSGKCFICPMRK